MSSCAYSSLYLKYVKNTGEGEEEEVVVVEVVVVVEGGARTPGKCSPGEQPETR